MQLSVKTFSIFSKNSYYVCNKYSFYENDYYYYFILFIYIFLHKSCES